MIDSSTENSSQEGEAAVAAGRPRGLIPVPEFDENRLQHQFDAAPELTARADRRNMRSKMLAGIRGLKHAIRGDSSFFAHGYRGTMIAITAALLGVNQWGWCLLVIAACLVLIAELAHSAVDTLARAIGDPEQPRLSHGPRDRRRLRPRRRLRLRQRHRDRPLLEARRSARLGAVGWVQPTKEFCLALARWWRGLVS